MAMHDSWKSDEEVELEIHRLQRSPAVKLAKKELNIKNRRRQYLSQLKLLEKRGQKLMDQGIDFDNIEAMLFGSSEGGDD